jgi:hypothetical protein
MTKGYVQIIEGEWFEPPQRNFAHQCCGCALTHMTDYRVVDGKVQFRVRIDNRKTAASRRKFKFKGGTDE